MSQEFTSFAYIYLGSGQENPARDRATIDVGGLRATMIAVPTESDAIQAAAGAARDGAQAIDLCAAFSTNTMAGVIKAVGPGIAVGRTTYGLEAVPPLARYQDSGTGE